MTDNELRLKAIEALNEALGVTAALRFLGMIQRDRTNYVEISRRLYKGQTVDDIFARARRR